MQNILRAFQVLNQDGAKTVSATYNKVDEEGNLVKKNASKSFYAVDEEIQMHISAIEECIMKKLEGGE